MTIETLARIDIQAAAGRIRGAVRRTPLEPFDVGDPRDPRIELRVKLECLQETGSFKARGACNNIARLTQAQRAAGVVATSSGNHGQALAWAAGRAGVKATVVMPANAYPNKIQACRDFGAEVVLGDDRPHAEELCAERVAAGATLVHPYDAEGTVEGAGTVGLEIADEWPEVEVVVIPVGGGGLIAGSSLALRRALGERVVILGSEPAGSPNMKLALEAGRPVEVDPITTSVQGLCPLEAGQLNTDICSTTVNGVHTLEDEVILATQRELVLRGGWIVEPAGAAAVALVVHGLPAELLEGRTPDNPLRVAAVVSGGNPDPEQLRQLREDAG